MSEWSGKRGRWRSSSPQFLPVFFSCWRFLNFVEPPISEPGTGKKNCKLGSGSQFQSFPHVSRSQLTVLGSLSKDVLERRTSTGSEAFFSFICLDSNKFALLSFLSLIKTICPRVWTNPLPNDAKSPLPVDVRRSKTLLLKLSSVFAKTPCIHLSVTP